MQVTFQEALQKAQQQETLTQQDLVQLLQAQGEEAEALRQLADQVRHQAVGDVVHLRGIIEFSNYCSQQCHYCGLRAGNTAVGRYRLSQAEIIEAAQAAVKRGYKTLVLQSGEDVNFSAEAITELVQELKKMDVAITLSCGERSYQVYEQWRLAGADRYLIKQETSDPLLFRKLRPGRTLEERLQCQRNLKELGYQLGTGCMVGLPGQTISTLADDILLMKQMKADMSGIGPFIPHSQTPLKNTARGSVELTLNMLAVARLVMPWLLLPSTTALSTLNPEGRKLALLSGANVIMPNVSPQEFRNLYQIYPDKYCINDPIDDHWEELHTLIHSLGRTVGTDYGHSMHPDFHL